MTPPFSGCSIAISAASADAMAWNVPGRSVETLLDGPPVHGGGAGTQPDPGAGLVEQRGDQPGLLEVRALGERGAVVAEVLGGAGSGHDRVEVPGVAEK